METYTHYFGSGYLPDVTLPVDCLNACSHQGECYDDCDRWLNEPEILEAFNGCTTEAIVKELSEYGAWTEDILQDRRESFIKLLWIIAGDYQENNI